MPDRSNAANQILVQGVHRKVRKINKKQFFAWGPSFIWAIVIFVVSVLPFKGPVLPISYFDKIIHFFEYFVLAFLVVRGLYHTVGLSFQKDLLLLLILGGGYGTLIELIQMFVPGRYASLGDVIANIIGVVFGTVLGEAVLYNKSS